jgi:seryl-tRNA synthetase
MLDIRALRNDLDAVARNLARRGYVLDRERFMDLEGRRKALQVEAESLRNERNERSKAIGQAKAAGQDIGPLKAEVGTLGEAMAEADQRLAQTQQELHALLAGIPNLLHESVPDGANETSNSELKRWGTPPQFDLAGGSVFIT